MHILLGLPARLLRRMGTLPVLVLVGVGLLVLGGVVASGWFAFDTYEETRADDAFCLSCHPMDEPLDRFAESAHRDLPCAACHEPALLRRGRTGLTRAAEDPAEPLEPRTHAPVPNRVCAECHVQGDPEEWLVVANTAGHRVHLESDDPALADIQCVDCHATSLHRFAAAEETCGQSACHVEESQVVLAGMSELTIHCVTCHTFSAPATPGSGPGTEAALAALAPDWEECLSCHVMRTLVTVPEPDPHESACGACHNPHTQENPEQALETCATSECHARPDTLSPFHRGMGPGVLENCMNCHEAHDFRVASTNCIACHQDIFDGSGVPVGVPSARTPVRDRVHRGEGPAVAGHGG